MFFVYFLVVTATKGSTDIVLPSLMTYIKGAKVLSISTCNSGLFLYRVKKSYSYKKGNLHIGGVCCVFKSTFRYLALNFLQFYVY